MESSSDLDVHPGSILLFLAEIVEIDVAEAGTKKTTKFARCGPDRRGSIPADDNFVVLFLTFWYVMHYFFLLVLRF